MMKGLTLRDLAAACGVCCDSDAVFTGNVVTDSRRVLPGDVFVALRGTQVDGHDFLDAVEKAGAVAAIVERTVTCCRLLQWEVTDAVQALGALAAINRQRFSGPVIGLTGSAGKTTTKEMIAAILRCAGSPLVTEGNLNNHLGVPMTLLRLSDEHDSAVIEMGASALGEIRYLTQLVKPNVALVTTVAPAHIEGFGSIDNVAAGKAEIFEGLAANGIAIVNADNAWTREWVARLQRQYQVVTYSAAASNACAVNVLASDIQVTAAGLQFVLHANGSQAPVLLRFLGLHNVGNAVAAAASCLAVGISLSQVVSGLAEAMPYKGRLQLHSGVAGSVVIDDTYNANPASVAMAVDALLTVAAVQRVLVLGDMAELGDASEALHEAVGQQAKAAGVKTLLACGDQSQATVRGFGEGARHFSDWQTLAAACGALAAVGVVFLVKGSRSAGMERVVAALLPLASDVTILDDVSEGRVQAC